MSKWLCALIQDSVVVNISNRFEVEALNNSRFHMEYFIDFFINLEFWGMEKILSLGPTLIYRKLKLSNRNLTFVPVKIYFF
jgi:hypothetical protein